jgi:hypothetical protein
VQEEDGKEPQQQLNNPAPQDTTETQPSRRIKPPSESMNGPVACAHAQRGEVPMRGGSRPQSPPEKKEKGGASDIQAQDALKLASELNLDIEIE